MIDNRDHNNYHKKKKKKNVTDDVEQEHGGSRWLAIIDPNSTATDTCRTGGETRETNAQNHRREMSS